MQPTLVAKHAVVDVRNPLQRDLSKHRAQKQRQEAHVELPTPESSTTKRPRQRSPFGLSWERDPYNPYKFLEPPEVVAQNQMFAVEFRILFDSEEYLIVYFYARLQPDNKPEYSLACERITTGRLQRVPLYIANAGVYSIEIVMVPEGKSFRPAVYRHENNITVLESKYEDVQVGSYEHKVLLGFDKPERVGYVDGGNDGQGSTDGGIETNMVGTDVDYLGSAYESAPERRDTIKYFYEAKGDYIRQWLNLSPEPEEQQEVDNNPELEPGN